LSFQTTALAVGCFEIIFLNNSKFIQTETIMDETLKINPYMEINFSILPTNAQHELYDFYLFLVSKYASKSRPQKITLSELVPRQVSPFVPLSRESIYDR
jgi:hypothetical protein